MPQVVDVGGVAVGAAVLGAGGHRPLLAPGDDVGIVAAGLRQVVAVVGQRAAHAQADGEGGQVLVGGAVALGGRHVVLQVRAQVLAPEVVGDIGQRIAVAAAIAAGAVAVGARKRAVLLADQAAVVELERAVVAGLVAGLTDFSFVPVAVGRQQRVVALAGVLHRVGALARIGLAEVAADLGQRAPQGCPAVDRLGAVEQPVEVAALQAAAHAAAVDEVGDVQEAAAGDGGVAQQRDADAVVLADAAEGAAHRAAHRQLAAAVVGVPVGVLLAQRHRGGAGVGGVQRDFPEAPGGLGRRHRLHALAVEDGALVGRAGAVVGPGHRRRRAGVGHVDVVEAVVQVRRQVGGRRAAAKAVRPCRGEAGVRVGRAGGVDRRGVLQRGIEGHAVALRRPVADHELVALPVLHQADLVRHELEVHRAGVVENEHDVRLDLGAGGVQRPLGDVDHLGRGQRCGQCQGRGQRGGGQGGGRRGEGAGHGGGSVAASGQKCTSVSVKLTVSRTPSVRTMMR